MSGIAKSRIDPELKRQAEAVLEEIGLKPRAALEVFCKKNRSLSVGPSPLPSKQTSQEDDFLSSAVRRNMVADAF